MQGGVAVVKVEGRGWVAIRGTYKMVICDEEQGVWWVVCVDSG